jgi:hypothetical protein
LPVVLPGPKVAD